MLSEQIKKSDIFSEMTDDAIDDILSMDGVGVVQIPLKNCYPAQNGIYIIVSGKIRVCKKEDGRETFLKYLMPGDSFGYTGLFMKSKDSRMGLLYAKERTSALFIPEDALVEIIRKNPQAAVNIISLLTDKIRFLNKKIDSFTSPTTESRLLKYLQSCQTDSDGRVILYENMAELARKLDMGRASLYRAFDSLEINGDIKKQKGEIYLIKRKSPHDSDEI